MAMTSHAFVTFPADPILAAIAQHRGAWASFMDATAETVSESSAAQRAALLDLLSTACTTRVGATILLRHLRDCMDADGRTLSLGCSGYALALARACDLALLLELPGATAPLPVAGALQASILRRLNRAGELAAAIAIIVGGIGLTGFASLL